MPVRVRVVCEGDAKIVFQSDQPRHGIGAGAVHADLSVMIDGHEREGRIDRRVDDRDVQFVGGIDRLPVADRGASQRVDGHIEAGGTNGVHVNDVPQGPPHKAGQSLPGAWSLPCRAAGRHALDAGVVRPQQLVGPILNPLRYVRIGRTAIGRVVFEPAVSRGIVRRRDDNAVGQVRLAVPVVNQNGARNDRRRGYSVVLLESRFQRCWRRGPRARCAGQGRKQRGYPCP